MLLCNHCVENILFIVVIMVTSCCC